MNYFINGPLTAVLVATGTVLNTVTVCILVRRRFSRQPSNYSEREIVNRHKVTACSYQSVPAQVSVAHKPSTSKAPPQQPACPSPRPRIYTYVLWLSCSDTTLLLSAFLMYCVPTLLHGSFGYYAYLFPVYYVMSNSALIASVWLMIALMIDRYRALCSPLTVALSFQKSLPVAHVHRVLAIVSFSAVIFSLPRFFELTLDHEAQTGEVFVRQTSLVDNMVYMVGYRIAGGIVFYSLFPYVVLFALSARIYCVVRHLAREQQKMHVQKRSNSKGRADSEMILLMVMAKFLISRLMPTALDLAEHISGADTFLHSQTATMFVDISNLVVVLSSTTNFFFFLFLSHSFRRIVMASFVSDPIPKTRYQLLSMKQHFRWHQNTTSSTSSPAKAPPDLHGLPASCQAEFLI
uniref:G_PROTEIN_RECEP_F1_2 domain-containing protein n=1 Tax=Steinernema glaseri TaxID=37863 RepID=A0A1I8A783_9BILA